MLGAGEMQILEQKPASEPQHEHQDNRGSSLHAGADTGQILSKYVQRNDRLTRYLLHPHYSTHHFLRSERQSQ